MNAQELKVVSEAVVLCILGVTIIVCLTVIGLHGTKNNNPKKRR
jgi:hypothetical protein